MHYRLTLENDRAYILDECTVEVADDPGLTMAVTNWITSELGSLRDGDIIRIKRTPAR